MLYGENRIVIFYKKTKTDKGYTRIGHIDNLDNISSGSVHVIFSK